MHAIGHGGIGGQGENLLVGELRGGGALGRQDVLDLSWRLGADGRGERGGGGSGVELGLEYR